MEVCNIPSILLLTSYTAHYTLLVLAEPRTSPLWTWSISISTPPLPPLPSPSRPKVSALKLAPRRLSRKPLLANMRAVLLRGEERELAANGGGPRFVAWHSRLFVPLLPDGHRYGGLREHSSDEEVGHFTLASSSPGSEAHIVNDAEACGGRSSRADEGEEGGRVDHGLTLECEDVPSMTVRDAMAGSSPSR